jgi:hypothetical protein
MKWTKVKDDLPKPFEVVWIYWRNREVLLGCKTDDDEHCEPEECWYSFDYEKCRRTHFWMRVSDSLNKPSPPRE